VGGVGGKTTRITRDGVTDAVNPFCGYLVVEAETADAADVPIASLLCCLGAAVASEISGQVMP
jgi:hypothetical protein